LHGERSHCEIETFHPQRRCAEDETDSRGRETGKNERNLEWHTCAHAVNRGVRADGHHGGIAKVNLSSPAHQQVEAERRRRPDNPGKEVAIQRERRE